MTRTSDRINKLAASETLEMSQRSSAMRARGIDVINLSVGETDFFTPLHIKEAAVKAIGDNYSFYSPVAGFADLREAIARKLERENGLIYNPEQIVVSNGAKQAVCNVLLSIIDPGDEVIVPAPYWVSYVEMVGLAGGVSVIVRAGIERDFKITPAQLEAAITPRTRAIILCSPSNPTGSVYSRAELESLVDILACYPSVTVISDEIYEHINYTGAHHSPAGFESIRRRTVVVNGVSKAYAMTGWRIGFIAAPYRIAAACNKLQGQYTSGACSVSQKAAVAAFDGDQGCVAAMCEAFRRRRDMVVALCSKIPGMETNTPEGAFYLFPKVDSYFGARPAAGATDTPASTATIIGNAADLSMYLLESAHVATVGGAAFGAPEHIRLSYATSDANITEAISRIAHALSLLEPTGRLT
ncbi:MAG: pyridoxal phosphate-dependent aminotransferase [Tannerellaceae bacterium]|jgi:aspartate aminotransferase|nr:pyridoxal phosphate-dependent aminotransferase [Tannerellaceae bacterium]